MFVCSYRSSLQHFLQLLGPFCHSFSEILDYLHFLYPKLFFLESCLSPLPLFFLWVLSCSFIWNIFFCHLILSKFLWLLFLFHRVLDYISCLPSSGSKLSKRLVQASLMGRGGLPSGNWGPSSCHLVVGCAQADCKPYLLVVGSIPSLSVVWPETSQHRACRLLSRDAVHSGGLMPMAAIPELLLPLSTAPLWARAGPYLCRETLNISK